MYTGVCWFNGHMASIIVDTFADFVAAAAHYTLNMPPSWRAGQGAFNLLCNVRPDLAELLRGSEFDPFHNNNRLPDFYDFVMRHWDDDKP